MFSRWVSIKRNNIVVNVIWCEGHSVSGFSRCQDLPGGVGECRAYTMVCIWWILNPPCIWLLNPYRVRRWLSSFPWGRWSGDKWENIKERDCPAPSSPTSRGQEPNRHLLLPRDNEIHTEDSTEVSLLVSLNLSVHQFGAFKHLF